MKTPYPLPLQEISLSTAALRNNLAVLQNKVPDAELWPCIKANAYGHGLPEVVSVMDDFVAGFCVVSTREALWLREYTTRPIFVLNIVVPHEIAACVAANIQLPLACDEHRQWYSQLGAPVTVHLEVDTGMARTGFRWTDPAEMVTYIQNLPSNIEIVGLYSHYPAAGEYFDYSENQFFRFQEFVAKYEETFGTLPLIHIDKSASTMFDQYHWKRNWPRQMIRPGIGWTGLGFATEHQDGLQPVLRWKTEVMSVRQVEAGAPIGYGLSYVVDKDTTIATIPIGYADGFDRSLSNSGLVLIGGELCPVRGRVCMNMTMVEVPAGVEVQVGTEVVIIGQQGEKMISAGQIAQWSNTTSYEVVTRLNPWIKRTISE